MPHALEFKLKYAWKSGDKEEIIRLIRLWNELRGKEA